MIFWLMHCLVQYDHSTRRENSGTTQRGKVRDVSWPESRVQQLRSQVPESE
jgi:hypothetical protein